MFLRIFLTLLLSFSGAAFAEPPQSSQSTKPPSPQTTAGRWFPTPRVPIPPDWKLLSAASDEFNAAGLDLGKWESDPGSWGTWSWDPRNVAQGGGRLALTMVHAPHERAKRTLFYKSGIVRSKAEVTYGYFEARIKGCHLFPGASPAFWLYSLGSYPGRVSYAEIDVVEMQQDSGPVKRPRMLDFNLHGRIRQGNGSEVTIGPGKNPELCEHRWRANFDPRNDFHVYSALVTAKRIIWYVDGQEVASEENPHWHLPMRVVLSLALRAPYVREEGGEKYPVPEKASGKGFPTTMEVDYVRVWTPPVAARKP